MIRKDPRTFGTCTDQKPAVFAIEELLRINMLEERAKGTPEGAQEAARIERALNRLVP